MSVYQVRFCCLLLSIEKGTLVLTLWHKTFTQGGCFCLGWSRCWHLHVLRCRCSKLCLEIVQLTEEGVLVGNGGMKVTLLNVKSKPLTILVSLSSLPVTAITSWAPCRCCELSAPHCIGATKEPCQRAPSVPSCVCANDLSFKICVFQVVKSPHSRRDRCYCYRRNVRML